MEGEVKEGASPSIPNTIKTLDDLKTLIRCVFPSSERIHFNSTTYSTMLVLLAFVFISQDVDELSKFFGYKGLRDERVRLVVTRIKKSGIVGPDGVLYIDWIDCEYPAISLTLDTMVILGELERVNSEGGVSYQKKETA